MPRRTAFEILRSGHPTPLRQVDSLSDRAGLDARDRGLVRAMVGTEIRHRGTLRAIVRGFTRGKPSADLATLLRLGVTQLLFLDRIPAHAALSETVTVVRDVCGMAKSRSANAILREIQRTVRSEHQGDPRRDLVGRPWSFQKALFRDPEQHPLLWAEDALSMPSALMGRWTRRLGWERAQELAKLAMGEPCLSLRVVNGERDPILAAFAESGAVPGNDPDVVLLPPDGTEALFTSQAFHQGQVVVQGQAAQAAARSMRAEAGEFLLDLCAAPGGKSLALAASGARVIACDRSPSRLANLPAACIRSTPRGAIHPVACDSTGGLAPDVRFDGVLVDAACTNTGVLAARPSARWRFGPQSTRELAALGARLLDDAAQRVRPGGRLVHSTCSLEPEENGQQVRAFLERHPGWELEMECEHLPQTGPGDASTDGGYVARLRCPATISS